MCTFCLCPLGENYMTVGSKPFHNSCFLYYCERIHDNREKEISNGNFVADTNLAGTLG